MKVFLVVMMAVAVALLSSSCKAEEMIDAQPISQTDERSGTGAESMILLHKLESNINDTRVSRKAPSVVRCF